MSSNSSPPPLSDDSAVESMASAAANGATGSTSTDRTQSTSSQHPKTIINLQKPPQQSNCNNPARPPLNHNPTPNNDHEVGLIKPDELRLAASRMRHLNSTLTSRSIRNNLSCFNDLDIQRFEHSPDYIVNFVSRGINKSQHHIHRPVSILWPDTYDKMIDQLSKLDAYLINTEYKEKPIDWMIARGLTTPPDCRQCKAKMVLNYERDSVRWHCQRTPTCTNLYAPVQRPSTFKGFENVGIMKLLFSIYYWATCTQCDLLYDQLRLEPATLHGIWRNIQTVCRVALEKAYPRFRLCNNPDQPTTGSSDQTLTEPIDLISIKLNGNYIVCAKHPRSNCVRLGLRIPNVSKYSFGQLTESWFAHGAHIRICESKFEELKKLRNDLRLDCVSRFQMVTKDKSFNRHSAFGYLICQLTHIFKDFDSTEITQESLKSLLAELEWRELFGTNPYDAFSKIVEHMATYSASADCYHEAQVAQTALQEVNCQDDSDYIYAEKYFYATMQPVDKNGKVIQRYGQKEYTAPIVQFRCHLCKSRFESFYFSMHMVAHVEANRKEQEETEYAQNKRIKCKHCFRFFKKRDIIQHSELFRADYQNMSFGCRICCLKFGNRARYLEHMRRLHFEHEMPYRCPSCKFGSSFQRELYIHFQEEHQLQYIILCPFCVRSFTILDPNKMDDAYLDQISKKVYDHISQHYLLAGIHSCDNCCLTFLDKKHLIKHQVRHHNPLEIFNDDVSVQPFIVTRAEEHFCVQAMPMELFIPNKQPNEAILEASHQKLASLARIETNDEAAGPSSSIMNGTRAIDNDEDFNSETGNNNINNKRQKTNGSSKSVPQRVAIPVADKYLAGGEASLRVNAKSNTNNNLTTEMIIDLMSRFKRADCIIPNQSVILHPEGGPLKCLDCGKHYTVDHLVSAIHCRPCKYVTYCPRALTEHKLKYHSN